jgi:hypothetical protein
MIDLVIEARRAILRRFLSLGAIANVSRREVAFAELAAHYRDWYRQARTGLIEDGCIDVPLYGFLRLTARGYLEARALDAEV